MTRMFGVPPDVRNKGEVAMLNESEWATSVQSKVNTHVNKTPERACGDGITTSGYTLIQQFDICRHTCIEVDMDSTLVVA